MANKSDQQKLNDILYELSSIIKELDSIADGVRRDFTGIGNAKCANAIDDVAEKYRSVRTVLLNLDMNTLSEEFLEQQVCSATL